MWALSNVTTEDIYSKTTTLETGPAKRVRITANNAGIIRQLLIARPGQGIGLAEWTPEIFLEPGTEIINEDVIYGARVRSASAGKPAQVTIQITPQ